MVFNKRKYADFKTFFMKKVKSLLVPYTIFSIPTWIVWAAFTFASHTEVDSYWMPLAQTFIAQGSGGFLVHNVPLWFITCLFVMEIVYYVVADWNKAWIILMSFGLAVGSYCMITYVDVIDVTLLPWNIEVVCLGMPFYAIGHFVVQKWGHEQMQNLVNGHSLTSLLIAFLLAGIVLVGSHFNGSISFGHAAIHNPFITYPCALSGVAMVLIVCMLLADIKACKNDVMWMKWLKWFGRNSFTAMAIHNPIKGFVCVIVGVLLGWGSSAVSQNGGCSLVAFAVTLVVTVVGITVVNWTKKKYKDLKESKCGQ